MILEMMKFKYNNIFKNAKNEVIIYLNSNSINK